MGWPLSTVKNGYQCNGAMASSRESSNTRLSETGIQGLLEASQVLLDVQE